MKRRSETAETKLKREIKVALEACGHYVLRVQSGVVKVKGGWMHLAPEGTADLLLFLRPGRTIGIEVKVPGEEPSDAQNAWAAKFTALGFEAACVHSVPEALALL